MKKAAMRTFSYVILAIILLIILKFLGEQDILPYVMGLLVISIVLFFGSWFVERKKEKKH